MTDLTAGNNLGGETQQDSPLAEFSAGSGPLLRKVLEALGWVAVAVLMFIGFTAIFERAEFMNQAMSQEFTDPIATFNPFDGRYVQHALATWAHLLPALIIFGLGPLQFIRGIRKNYLNFHRWSGRVWLIAGFIAALSGAFIGVLNPFTGVDGQGFNESMATLFFALYTLFCLVKAYTHIRQRNFGAHREWMIRSWALMLAVATERVMLGVLMGSTGIDIAVLFGTTFWMAGIVNIVASEIWINLTRTPGNGARHWKDLDARAAGS